MLFAFEKWSTSRPVFSDRVSVFAFALWSRKFRSFGLVLVVGNVAVVIDSIVVALDTGEIFGSFCSCYANSTYDIF